MSNTVKTMDDAARWRAVLGRDASCDDAFVYGVASTKIFCRPSCPSRRPRREGVRFFGDVADARRAGYRPCKRCRPESALSEETDRSARAARELENNSEASLQELGRATSSSPYHLHRTFKRTTGITPRQYAVATRTAKLKAGLKEGATVTEAMYNAGYGSSRALYEHAASQLGMTPASYKRGGAGATIRYAISPSPLGQLLVAATEKGICSIKLGDETGKLETELREEFSAATLQRDQGGLGEWVTLILAHLRGQQPHLDLPLDVQATAFQWRVWQALQEIPYGETRSYAQIATAIGQPTAARAVARACATNSAALVIPCHRVIHGDGSLSGYRWGCERKKKLLETEKSNRK